MQLLVFAHTDQKFLITSEESVAISLEPDPYG